MIPWAGLVVPSEILTGAACGFLAGWFLRTWVRRRTARPVAGAGGALVPAEQSGMISEEGSAGGAPPASILHPRPAGPSQNGTLGLSATTAGRVILHIARLGRVGADEVAPSGSSQKGMSGELGVRQGTLTKVLQRLVAAGALTVDRRHVAGSDRRLKVYRLTELGESIARDLRRRRS
jgi:hypothetical protein